MSLVYVCDLCEVVPAEYEIAERVRVRWTRVVGWDVVKTTLRICVPCWTAIGEARKASS